MGLLPYACLWFSKTQSKCDCGIILSNPVKSEADLLTKSGHSIARFIKQQEGNHEEGVWGTQDRLKRYKLLKRDQPERREEGRKKEDR